MIRAVHDGDSRVRVAKMLAEGQPAKARAQHDDLNWLVSIHALNLRQQRANAIVRKQYSPPRTQAFAKFLLHSAPGFE